VSVAVKSLLCSSGVDDLVRLPCFSAGPVSVAGAAAVAAVAAVAVAVDTSADSRSRSPLWTCRSQMLAARSINTAAAVAAAA